MTFKLAVVTEVEAGAMTYKQAQTFYGIQGRSTVLVWLRKYGVLNWKAGTPKLKPSLMGKSYFFIIVGKFVGKKQMNYFILMFINMLI